MSAARIRGPAACRRPSRPNSTPVPHARPSRGAGRPAPDRAGPAAASDPGPSGSAPHVDDAAYQRRRAGHGGQVAAAGRLRGHRPPPRRRSSRASDEFDHFPAVLRPLARQRAVGPDAGPRAEHRGLVLRRRRAWSGCVSCRRPPAPVIDGDDLAQPAGRHAFGRGHDRVGRTGGQQAQRVGKVPPAVAAGLAGGPGCPGRNGPARNRGPGTARGAGADAASVPDALFLQDRGPQVVVPRIQFVGRDRPVAPAGPRPVVPGPRRRASTARDLGALGFSAASRSRRRRRFAVAAWR